MMPVSCAALFSTGCSLAGRIKVDNPVYLIAIVDNSVYLCQYPALIVSQTSPVIKMTEKQLSIVRTALRLFYRQGIHAVGINEIIQQSGVAKKTLYNYFASKEELVLAALAYRDDIFMNWLTGRMDSVDAGSDALIEMFYGLDDWFNDRAEQLGNFRGCFFINASGEYTDPQTPVHQACKAHKANVKQQVLGHTRLLSYSSDDADQAADRLAETLCLLKEGAITTAMVQEDPLAARNLIPLVTNLVKNT